jgi:hypothetical protein
MDETCPVSTEEGGGGKFKDRDQKLLQLKTSAAQGVRAPREQLRAPRIRLRFVRGRARGACRASLTPY